MDEPSVEDDTGSECLQGEEHVEVRTQGRDPIAENGDAYTDEPAHEDEENGSNLVLVWVGAGGSGSGGDLSRSNSSAKQSQSARGTTDRSMRRKRVGLLMFV